MKTSRERAEDLLLNKQSVYTVTILNWADEMDLKFISILTPSEYYAVDLILQGKRAKEEVEEGLYFLGFDGIFKNKSLDEIEELFEKDEKGRFITIEEDASFFWDKEFSFWAGSNQELLFTVDELRYAINFAYVSKDVAKKLRSCSDDGRLKQLVELVLEEGQFNE